MNVPTAKRVKRYLSVFLRWGLIGSAVFGLTVLAGLYITNNVLTKVYTATTTLELPASDLAAPAVAFQPDFETTILSPEFLLAVIKDLGLDKEWAKRLYNSDQDQLPDVDALTRLQKLVKIDIKRGTRLVKITVASDVPEEAANIANSIARHYKSARETGEDQLLRHGGVQILLRAVPPAEPTKPNKHLDFIITLVVAGILSIMAASFVEMVLLFIRAGERTES